METRPETLSDSPRVEEAGSHNHPWRESMTERTLQRVDGFAGSPFPREWIHWCGIGPKGAVALREAGIYHPTQLLGESSWSSCFPFCVS